MDLSGSVIQEAIEKSNSIRKSSYPQQYLRRTVLVTKWLYQETISSKMTKNEVHRKISTQPGVGKVEEANKLY